MSRVFYEEALISALSFKYMWTQVVCRSQCFDISNITLFQDDLIFPIKLKFDTFYFKVVLLKKFTSDINCSCLMSIYVSINVDLDF